MRLLKVFLTICILTLTYGLSAITPCECGSHDVGIISYGVDGDNCCSSPPVATSNGYETTYEQNEGVWEIVKITTISNENAQNQCCQPG